MGLLTGVTERDAARALLRIEEDLHRTLMAPPAGDNQRDVWVDTVSALLIEQARGRLFLERLRHRAAYWDAAAARNRELAS